MPKDRGNPKHKKPKRTHSNKKGPTDYQQTRDAEKNSPKSTRRAHRRNR